MNVWLKTTVNQLITTFSFTDKIDTQNKWQLLKMGMEQQGSPLIFDVPMEIFIYKWKKKVRNVIEKWNYV